jgi:hypothetical protein
MRCSFDSRKNFPSSLQMRVEAEKAKAKELTFKPAISHAYAPKRVRTAVAAHYI